MATIWKAAWIPYVIGLFLCFVVGGTFGLVGGVYSFGIAGGWFIAPLFYKDYDR